MNIEQVAADPVDRSRYPADPWRLVEVHPDAADLGAADEPASRHDVGDARGDLYPHLLVLEHEIDERDRGVHDEAP